MIFLPDQHCRDPPPFCFAILRTTERKKAMFDKKNDAARNKKRADAIVYAGAAGEVVLTQNDFESEAEFRRWKTWSDEDYKRTEKVKLNLLMVDDRIPAGAKLY